jgi:hypothetical protein
MNEYEKQELIKSLALEGLRHRQNRVNLRKMRLERSRVELAELEQQVHQAITIVQLTAYREV